MGLIADFAVALVGAGTGAGLGSYLGYRLGLRASEAEHVRERRLALATQFMDAALALIDLAGEAAMAKKRGLDLTDHIHQMMGQELRVAELGNLIGYDHPEWQLSSVVTEADIKHSVLIRSWNHAADPGGAELTAASAKLLGAVALVWRAELGDESADQQLRTKLPN